MFLREFAKGVAKVADRGACDLLQLLLAHGNLHIACGGIQGAQMNMAARMRPNLLPTRYPLPQV